MTTRAQVRDVTAVVDTMARVAVERYYSDARAGVMPFYLWYQGSAPGRDGDLRFVPDETPMRDIGWQIADPQAHRGSWSREQLFNHVRLLVGRLPILAP